MIVTVTRSGGYAGLERTAELDTAAVDDGDLVERAVRRIDPDRVVTGPPLPDLYTYRLAAGGTELTVAEQDLEPELAWLVDRVLGRVLALDEPPG